MRKVFRSALTIALVLAMLFSVSVPAFAYGAWSEWTTDTSKLSDSRYESESKSQYSTRTKETTTSTSGSLSGWTRDDSKTTTQISWGGTTWYDYQISTSSTCRYVGSRQVQTGTQYYLYRYYSATYNSFATYKKDSTYKEDGYWVSTYYSYDPYKTGQALYQSNEISGSKYPCWKSSTTRQVTKTQYGYQTGTPTYTYSYYRYSDWSAWTDGTKTAGDTVQTRKLYRYRLKDSNSVPTASITAQNKLSSTQKVTIKVADDYGLQGYFFGTNSDYKKNSFTQLSGQTSYTTELSVTSAATYYLVAINSKDKVSTAACVTLCTITLNPSGGTVSAQKLLLTKGYQVTLPTPSKNNCSFLGWATSQNAASGAQSVTVSGNQTYYAVWGNVSASGWSRSNQFKFANSAASFTTGVYTLKDRDLTRLENYIRSYYSNNSANRIINSITQERTSSWGGSCYGMSLSAILDYTNQIGLNENFGNSAATVYDISAPYMNADAQSAINYYFLTQFIPEIANAYLYAQNDESNWSMALSNLVNKVKKGELVSFLYATSSFGHSIVLKSYGGTDSSGNYILKAYDNRYPNYDVNVVISSDWKTCTVCGSEQAYEVAYLSNYDIYDKYDIDGKNNDMSVTVTSGTKQTLTGTTITVSTAENMTIRNAENKTVVIRNGKVDASSTAKILSKRMVVTATADQQQSAPMAVIRVNDSEYFSFETAGSTIDATVSSEDTYTSVCASDVASAVISEDDGVSVNGDHAKYTVTRSVEEDDFDMFSFTGMANGTANVDYSEGKIYVSGNVPGDVKVSKFAGTEYETVSYSTSRSYVSVTMVEDYCESHSYQYQVVTKASESCNGEAYRYCTKCGHKESTQTVAKIASVALSATSYKYDGTVKTPTVTVTDSSGKKLVQGSDYTVSYASGRTAVGTYAVKVTFQNRYSGSKTLSFSIVPGSTKLVLSSVTNAEKGVMLKWGAIQGAASYAVYYKNSSGGWSKINSTTQTAVVVTGVKSGTKYTFTARAFDKNGKAVGSYDTAGKSITYIAQPALSSVANAANGITVKWTAVKGAAQYRVYYKTTGGKWTKAGDTKGTSFTMPAKSLKSGTSYTFTVRCLSADGKSFTSSYNATGKSIVYLARTAITGLSNSASKTFTVKWNKITGVTGYQVYYKVGKTAKTVTVKSASAVSKAVSGLSKGSTYSVYVRGYKTVGKVNYYSAWSAAKTVKISK